MVFAINHKNNSENMNFLFKNSCNSEFLNYICTIKQCKDILRNGKMYRKGKI